LYQYYGGVPSPEGSPEGITTSTISFGVSGSATSLRLLCSRYLCSRYRQSHTRTVSQPIIRAAEGSRRIGPLGPPFRDRVQFGLIPGERTIPAYATAFSSIAGCVPSSDASMFVKAPKSVFHVRSIGRRVSGRSRGRCSA
jgi:hypothetical protein